MKRNRSSEDKSQLERRKQLFRLIQQGLDHYQPPFPNGMDYVIQQLRYLEDHVQDEGQRSARESLITACQAYARKDERGDKEALEAIRVARHSFEMRWEYETGEMILPSGIRD